MARHVTGTRDVRADARDAGCLVIGYVYFDHRRYALATVVIQAAGARSVAHAARLLAVAAREADRRASEHGIPGL